MKKNNKCVWITKLKGDEKKKMRADFKLNDDNDDVKSTKFGAQGYSDYTQHKDKKRKENYLARHRPRENWTDPTSAGTLSRYILWEKPGLKDAIRSFAARFNLSLCVKPTYWGPATWRMLHAAASSNSSDNAATARLISSVAHAMPCRVCRCHFKKELRIQKRKKKRRCCNARDVFELHNKVNVRLNKKRVKWENRKKHTLDIDQIRLLIDLFWWNIKRQGLGKNSKRYKAVEYIEKYFFKSDR